jgi:seryl-tRNA synthetase
MRWPAWVGQKPGWNHEAKEHFEIGEALGYMDFERAAQAFRLALHRFDQPAGASGTGAWPVHDRSCTPREHGYTEVSSPLLVRDEAMFGTGQLPKFSEDLFQDHGWPLVDPDRGSLAHQSRVSEEILDQEKLPLRFTALTPCFRSEAGIRPAAIRAACCASTSS